MKGKMVRESTLATYVTNAEKHILPVFGRSVEVMENGVQMFVFGKLGQGLSVHTVRDIVLVLRMFVAYGVRKGRTEWHKWGVRLPKGDAGHGVTVLTLGEQLAVMSFLRMYFTFRNLGLYICLCTGMRIGEVCALRWSGVSISFKLVNVSCTIERVYVIESWRKYTKVIIGAPKTASSRRDIPISGELVRMLKSVMKFHGLRRTFATRCVEVNCDYKTVSDILGCSDASITLDIYVHPDIGRKRKCIGRLLRGVR